MKLKTESDWSEHFKTIQILISEKDFESAKKFIDDAIVEASEVFIDPRMVIRELKAEKTKIERLETSKI